MTPVSPSIAALLAVLLSVPAQAVAGVVYFCATDDVVHDACCCGPADAGHECCCTPQLEEADDPEAANEAATTVPAISAPAGPITLRPAPPPLQRGPQIQLGARGPPPAGAPLYVLHATLLI